MVAAPLFVTLFILFKLFNFFFDLLTQFKLHVNPYFDPVLILALIVFTIYLIGLSASSILLKPVFAFFERTLEHAPVVKHIYSPVKDFVQAFMGNKKRFTHPVLVLTNPQANIEEMGFVTQEDLNDLGISDKVAVYMPHSYAFSGKLIIVPKTSVRPLEAKGGGAMKFIVTGGVADINEEEN